MNQELSKDINELLEKVRVLGRLSLDPFLYQSIFGPRGDLSDGNDLLFQTTPLVSRITSPQSLLNQKFYFSIDEILSAKTTRTWSPLMVAERYSREIEATRGTVAWRRS